MKRSTEGIYEVIHTFRSNQLRQLSVIPGDKVGVYVLIESVVCTHVLIVRMYVRTYIDVYVHEVTRAVCM